MDNVHGDHALHGQPRRASAIISRLITILLPSGLIEVDEFFRNVDISVVFFTALDMGSIVSVHGVSNKNIAVRLALGSSRGLRKL